tara:strand:+ start:99 stop:461 length:363 start_codon:yes stop_codon:yes gene_type:complete
MLIKDSITVSALKYNISEITRMDTGIKEKADPKFNNASKYLPKEIARRISALSKKITQCNISSPAKGERDYTVPLLLSGELIKMLQPVFDKCYSRNIISILPSPSRPLTAEESFLNFTNK